MTTVVVIRPGCTSFDEQDRVQGVLNLPLTEHGHAEVSEIVERLRDVPLEVIYTAPAEPALSTARAIGEALSIPVRESEELRNLDQGLWQGLTTDEIRRKYPRVFKQWRESPETVCPPEGETIPHALARVRKALQKPLRKNERVAVVAPEPLATLIRCLLCGDRISVPISGERDRRGPRIEILNIDDQTSIEELAVTAAGTPSSRRIH